MKGLNCKFMKIIISLLLLCLIALFISCDENTCGVCGGSGKCYECRGKGYIKVDTNICDVCKGTGMCFNCQGTGKIKNNKIVRNFGFRINSL
jgi:hypothetical protein